MRAAISSTLALGSIGCLAHCMTKQDPETTTATKPASPVTLTAAEKASLDANGFLNISSIVLVKDGGTYRAFSRSCPHEGGEVTALTAASLQCQRHTEQFYNKLGQGNGARTSGSLAQYTVTENGGVLTIS